MPVFPDEVLQFTQTIVDLQQSKPASTKPIPENSISRISTTSRFALSSSISIRLPCRTTSRSSTISWV